MKLLKIFPVFIILLLAFNGEAGAQCKAFAKSKCLPQLAEYTHDGNYHATVLTEGEEAELYKTFYSDMDYRMVVCGEDTIGKVVFTVTDASGNVLFSNKDASNTTTWDFKLQSSQQLKVMVKVNSSSQQGINPAQGCVSIMFGFKVKKS
jgi:hypothetical protein